MRKLLLAALLLAPVAGHAQGIDMTKGGPVEVTSRDGMEWHQDEQIIVAKGDAKAVRGTVTVTADQLIAHYRKKAGTGTPPAPGAAATLGAAPNPAAPAPGAAGASATPDTGNNEIYRLEAVGKVHIYTPTDQAFGDKAIYDIDQSVLVMTGHDLHIVTPQQTMSARDTLEYWSQKHMAVGRGNAVVNTSDGRRLTADVLVGYTADPNAPPTAAPVQKVVAPAAKPGADPLGGASGKLQRVDAFGHVEVRTATEIIKADKGVYVPDTGIARLAGNVHLTRGQNQLNGDQAVINLRTGVSTLSRNPGQRVEGLVVPNDAGAPPGAPKTAKPGDKTK
ncbi:LptA/OstA family protein [Acidisphaera sp. L21]|uniref:LptA/OstA family protein n=1 Tax=Acidisphaera sp. L21 TaxID=1641851 RepID=UPI00131C04C6|nr:LptA/OstA family protein [Acidisphaera sp. L21]